MEELQIGWITCQAKHLIHLLDFHPAQSCVVAVHLAVKGEVDASGGEQPVLVLHQPDGGEGEGGDREGGEKGFEEIRWQE